MIIKDNNFACKSCLELLFFHIETKILNFSHFSVFFVDLLIKKESVQCTFFFLIFL